MHSCSSVDEEANLSPETTTTHTSPSPSPPPSPSPSSRAYDANVTETTPVEPAHHSHPDYEHKVSTPTQKAGEHDGAGEEEQWQELHDESGHVYYFNTRTSVSQWDAPTWIEESDSVSGSVYYVNSVTGEAQVFGWFFDFWLLIDWSFSVFVPLRVVPLLCFYRILSFVP